MKTEVERLERNEVKLKVEVPAEEFGTAIDQAFKKISQKMVVPGFRKGKVPRQIVEQRVGLDYIVGEAVRDSLPYFYIQAVNKSGIVPIDQPQIDVEQARRGLPLVFTAKVEVKPEVKLGEYEGVQVEKPDEAVADEDVERQIMALQETLATLEESPESEVKEGDFVLMDFKGYVDDQPIEGGAAEDYLLEVGSKEFVPGVEEQMVGMAKGETKEIWVDIPENYHAEQIAGKRIKFDMTVKEIKRKKLPEVNDDLAKQIGFDTMEDVRNDVRERIGETKKKTADIVVRNEIIRKVTEEAEVDLPEVMVERKLDEMVSDFARNLQTRGMSLEQYLEASQKTLEELRDTLKPEAHFQIKSGLVLEAIAKAEGLEPTADEIDNELKRFAEGLGQDPEEVKSRMIASGSIGLIAEQVLIKKTLDRLVEKADIKVKPEVEEKSKKAKKAEKSKAKRSSSKPATGSKGKEERNSGESPEGGRARSEKRDEE